MAKLARTVDTNEQCNYTFVVTLDDPTTLHLKSKKAQTNVRKHGVEFELAVLVYSDPFAGLVQDRIVGDERRWRTTGMINDGRVLIVAHTIEDDQDDGELVRIISARFATRSERRTYEEESRRHL